MVGVAIFCEIVERVEKNCQAIFGSFANNNFSLCSAMVGAGSPRIVKIGPISQEITHIVYGRGVNKRRGEDIKQWSLFPNWVHCVEQVYLG